MVGGNPFPGLRPFEADESHLFFGRETATDELLRKLRTNRFIAVLGTSGSGKSSLVLAGMLPDLYGGFMAEAGSRWRVAILRPGDAPIRALAESLSAPGVLGHEGQQPEMQHAITETVLRRGAFGLLDATRQARLAEGDNLLVLVDQFEELFRIHGSLEDRSAKDESAAFVKLLLEAARQTELPIYVMLTMRSEYLGDCTRFRDLPEAINSGQYLIPRMTRDQARKAITGPIAVAGARISPPLVQRLLNDVGDNPDQLPIMQHAMMRTWSFWEADRREGEEIGVAHYQATGGMDEALSRHADEAYEELPDAATRTAAGRIFKRLTGRGAGDRELRYPATVAELCAVSGVSRDKVLAVIDAFRRDDRSLLMPPSDTSLSDETVIDISHESLIRIWKRLRQWVEEETQSARIYTRLAETSDLHSRKEAGLWRNPDLQIALNWRERNQPNEAWSRRYHARFGEAMAFLDAGKSAAFRRKIITIVPAILIPVVGAAYVVTKAVNEKVAAVQQLEVVRENKVKVVRQLKDVRAEKEEFEAALENVQQEVEIEQQEVKQAVVAQVDKFKELTNAKQAFESREAELQGEMDRLLAALREVKSDNSGETEREKIQQDLMGVSQRLEAVQRQARQEEAQIESEIVESAEQLTEQLAEPPGEEQPRAGPELSVADAGTAAVIEDPLAAESTNMAALEVPVADQADPVTVEPADASPGQADDLAESKEVEPAPVMVVNAGDSEGHTQGQTGEVPAEAQEPAACVEARESEGNSPITERLKEWKACQEAAGEQEVKSLAVQEIAALETALSRYASISVPENFLTCTNVKSLECVGDTDHFSGGKVYVFARVHAPESTTLALRWFRQDGAEFRASKLKVKQNTDKGFRTFTWKSVTEPGGYVVRLYNEQDMLIGARTFSVH